MIIRTYTRRSRTTYTDPLRDAVLEDNSLEPSFCLSQDLPFSSQESSSLDPRRFDYLKERSLPNGAVPRKTKKPRNGKLTKNTKKISGPLPLIIRTSTTLMEAQESGEMMEHVDEINFALDGLVAGQPVRIRRASLLSLLSVCSAVHQRQILRSRGMAKTIIDATLDLSLDDSPSNIGAAALFYILTSDGQDDHLLESSISIRFLMKLLKPVASSVNEKIARNIGSRLTSLRKDCDIIVRDINKPENASSAAAIFAKVQELLVSGKDIIGSHCRGSGTVRPEISPIWIALLTMEKACLSTITLEDASGTVKHTGSSFKEKLREHGGLDAVFEVARSSLSVVERDASSPSFVRNARGDLVQRSLVMLLKALKIMENATFLSKENQSHLLGMKGCSRSLGCKLSFTEFLLSAIQILSGMHLKLSDASCGRRPCNISERNDLVSDLLLTDGHNDDEGFVSISSLANSDVSEKCISRVSLPATTESEASATTTAVMNNAFRPSTVSLISPSSSRSNSSGSYNCECATINSDALTRSSDMAERHVHITESSEVLPAGKDPYAFNKEDQPSNWDLLSGKQTQDCAASMGGCEVEHQNLSSRQVKLNNHGSCCMQTPIHMECDHSQRTFCRRSSNSSGRSSSSSSSIDGGDDSSLLAECLLTSVKVLMNLTNDNHIGCEEIAASGGLEAMSNLIGDHFSLYSSSLSSLGNILEDNCHVQTKQNDTHLTDQELDFLVAILGLLVNLVEKDAHNRSRLAAGSISFSSSENLHKDSPRSIVPLLCSIFLANRVAVDVSEEGNAVQWSEEEALVQGEKEAEKMIIEAYAALLLAFISNQSDSIRKSIADCLPSRNLRVLVPVLERFVAFHLALNMISPDTHEAVNQVIESCRVVP